MIIKCYRVMLINALLCCSLQANEKTVKDFLIFIHEKTNDAAKAYAKLGTDFGQFNEIAKIFADYALGQTDLISNLETPEQYTLQNGQDIIKALDDLITFIQLVETAYPQPIDDLAFGEREIIRQISKDTQEEIKTDFKLE